MPGSPPPDVVAAFTLTERWTRDSEEAAARAANPQPTAVERFDAIRTAQAQAMSEGRVLPIPAPVAVAAAIDPASMTPSQRWGMWRNPGSG
jgi:hypothetical protein